MKNPKKKKTQAYRKHGWISLTFIGNVFSLVMEKSLTIKRVFFFVKSLEINKNKFFLFVLRKQ